MSTKMNTKAIVCAPDRGVDLSGFVKTGESSWTAENKACIDTAYTVEIYSVLTEIRALLRTIRQDILTLGSDGLHVVIQEQRYLAEDLRKKRRAKDRAARKAKAERAAHAQ